MKKYLILSLLILFNYSLFSQEAEISEINFSPVDFNITSSYAILSFGSGYFQFPDFISDNIKTITDTANSSNYNFSITAGIYTPWHNKKTLIGFRSNFYYYRNYTEKAFGNGAIFEVLSGDIGIDLQRYFGERAGRGLFIHILNSFAINKYGAAFEIAETSPWGYGLTLGTGIGLPLKIFPGLESTSIVFDYNFKYLDGQKFNYYNLSLALGGFF